MKKIKNFLLLLFCKIFKVRSNPISDCKRILIVSTTALGDTLWATAALESLRQSFPSSYISILTSSIGYAILKTNPNIDKIFVIPKKFFSYFSLAQQLRKEKFNTVVVFHTSQRIVLPLCSIIGATTIIGTKGITKGLDSLYTQSLKPIHQHEIERRLDLIQAIGATAYCKHLSFFLQEEEKPAFFLDNYILLHPGSKDPFKRWPLDHFAKVGIELSNLGYKICISGTFEEKKILEELQSKIPFSSIIPSGLSLHAFAHILKAAKLLISNDTGPLHLACALKTPCIGIFGGTDASICGTYKAIKAISLSHPIPCTPCLKRKCQKPFCLYQVSVKDVLESAQKLLNNFSLPKPDFLN